MRGNTGIAVLLIATAAVLAGCGQKSGPRAAEKVEHVQVEALAQEGIKRVVLTEKAARRLGIKTDSVREERIVRKRAIGGDVVALPAAASASGAASAGGTSPGDVLVRVQLNTSDLERVDRTQPALVLPVGCVRKVDRNRSSAYAPSRQGDWVCENAPAGSGGTVGVTAQPVDTPAAGEPEKATGTLSYLVRGPGHGLAPGHRVLVELPQSDSGRRMVVPYTAVLYDLNGETWAYTNPEPLRFVRHRIGVDFVEADLAALSQGPPPGTAVVTVGATELFGAELGVGGH